MRVVRELRGMLSTEGNSAGGIVWWIRGNIGLILAKKFNSVHF